MSAPAFKPGDKALHIHLEEPVVIVDDCHETLGETLAAYIVKLQCGTSKFVAGGDLLPLSDERAA